MRNILFGLVGVVALLLSSCALTQEGAVLMNDKNPSAVNCHYVLDNIQNYSFHNSCQIIYCLSKKNTDTLSGVCSRTSGLVHHSYLPLNSWNKTGDISNCNGHLKIGPC